MLSIPHLIVIFIVALVVFGPEKIPELARNLGKIMAEFRRVTGDLRSTFEGHLRDLEREADQRRTAASTPQVVPPPVPISAEASTPLPPSQTSSAPSGSAPGTVPSNPLNAAALNEPPPPPPANYVPDPDEQGYTKPGDPMHDPYLMSVFPEHERQNGTKSTEAPAESAPESERVTDGDRRVS
jgi:sec-independent protein translocase protein TatB